MAHLSASDQLVFTSSMFAFGSEWQEVRVDENQPSSRHVNTIQLTQTLCARRTSREWTIGHRKCLCYHIPAKWLKKKLSTLVFAMRPFHLAIFQHAILCRPLKLETKNTILELQNRSLHLGINKFIFWGHLCWHMAKEEEHLQKWEKLVGRADMRGTLYNNDGAFNLNSYSNMLFLTL